MKSLSGGGAGGGDIDSIELNENNSGGVNRNGIILTTSNPAQNGGGANNLLGSPNNIELSRKSTSNIGAQSFSGSEAGTFVGNSTKSP